MMPALTHMKHKNWCKSAAARRRHADRPAITFEASAYNLKTHTAWPEALETEKKKQIKRLFSQLLEQSGNILVSGDGRRFHHIIACTGRCTFLLFCFFVSIIFLLDLYLTPR